MYFLSIILQAKGKKIALGIKKWFSNPHPKYENFSLNVVHVQILATFSGFFSSIHLVFNLMDRLFSRDVAFRSSKSKSHMDEKTWIHASVFKVHIFTNKDLSKTDKFNQSRAFKNNLSFFYKSLFVLMGLKV